MARIINSPGVQITEIDLSTTASLPAGTNVLVHGFAPQGQSDELIYVTGKEDFESTFFGTNGPTNAAEKYFYHTCKEILNSPANLLVTRLPYGSGDGIGFDGQYSALVYPVVSLLSTSSAVDFQSATSLSIGSPVLTSLTENQYFALQDGDLSWATVGNGSTSSIAQAGFIIVNTVKSTINENYEGFYIALADNTTVVTSGFDAISAVDSINSSGASTTLPSSLLAFSLTGGAESYGNISRTIETSPAFDFSDSAFKDSLIFYAFKLVKDVFGNDDTKLQAIPYENFVGSLNEAEVQNSPINGLTESFYLANKINNNSNYFKMFVNSNLAKKTNWVVQNTKQVTVTNSNKVLEAIGTYSTTKDDQVNKLIGSLPAKIERALLLAENRETVDIDLVVEAGLGTVWGYTYSSAASGGGGFTDNPADIGTKLEDLENSSTGGSSELANSYKTVYNLYENFCREGRKDCMLIADPIRGIFVRGNDTKTLTRRSNNFSQNIYTPLRNLYSTANSNYAATYANWVRVYDSNSNNYMWVPFSGWEAAIMARMDANLYPWYAPAGLENGVVRNIVDIAITPTQKQRDLLYKIGINPVVFFPQDGFVVWGQKTLQAKPSAFDRINVRRLFLTLEKATLKLARYFVMQPNSVFTRARLTNTLRPIFDIAKNNEGVYDYLIVCDEKNNTPQVIDNNELKVDIYIKPVRTAEFILINFYATRTSQDFSELVG